jgi:hypothetical protein
MEKDYYEGESTGNKLVTLSYTTLNENSDDHKHSDNDYSYTFSVKDGQTWYSVVRATQHMLINMGYRFGDDIDFVEVLDEAIQNNLDLYVNNKNLESYSHLKDKIFELQTLLNKKDRTISELEAYLLEDTENSNDVEAS